MNILILGLVFLVISFTEINLLFKDIAVLSVSFSIIAILTLIIFSRGLTKNPESQVLHSLASISLKLLMDIVLALVWFLVTKNTSLSYVLTFFVIYLTLTLFSISNIHKELKKRSL